MRLAFVSPIGKPLLNLSPADEEDIATYSGDKRIKMLRRWQEKIGSGATYRSLADSFQKIDRADLIDKIRALLTGSLLINSTILLKWIQQFSYELAT